MTTTATRAEGATEPDARALSRVGLQPKHERPRVHLIAVVSGTVWLAVALVPFQKAFTLSVGDTPVKASEVLLVLAIGLGLFVRLPPVPRVQKRLIIAVACLTALSAAVNGVLNTPDGRFLGYDTSLVQDITQYLLYSLLILAGWRLISALGVRRFKSALVLATWFALASCVLQLFLYATGRVDLLRSLGFELVFGGSYGGASLRNGSFFEGNYLGLFAGAAFFVLLRFRAWFTAIAALGCIAYSQSTNTILAVIAGLVVLALVRPTVLRVIRLVAALVVAGVVALQVPGVASFAVFQLSKLGVGGTDDVNVGSAAASLPLRVAKSQAAFEMMLSNPFLGVGPGRFSVWFPQFVHGDDRIGFAYLASGRALVENAHLQLGAEVGVPALLCFLGLFAVILRTLVTRRAPAADVALVAFLLIALATAPSWTTVTIWVFVGYLTAVTSEVSGLRGSGDGLATPPRLDDPVPRRRIRGLSGSRATVTPTSVLRPRPRPAGSPRS